MAFISSWHWYSVRTLSRTVIFTSEHQPVPADETVYTESVFIVKAQSYAQACKIAEHHAKAQKNKYKNIYGQTVFQQFDSVVDCYFFEHAPEAGMQVYTCQYRLQNGEAPLSDFLQQLHQRH